jgi:hypothetical protein
MDQAYDYKQEENEKIRLIFKEIEKLHQKLNEMTISADHANSTSVVNSIDKIHGIKKNFEEIKEM